MCKWHPGYREDCLGPGWCWACHEAGDVLLSHFACYYVESELRALIDDRRATLWFADDEWHVVRLDEAEEVPA